MITTYQKYSDKFQEFFQTILKTNPDYIVPVERKGCKLLRSLKTDQEKLNFNIRYKQFFVNTKQDMFGKRVAVIDDATKYTSSLLEYRNYFESLGAIVDTYSFVGQIFLETAEREQYDTHATIFQHLYESTYQEYVIEQSQKFSNEDCSFDIDHIVFGTSLSVKRYKAFIRYLDNLGEIDYSNDMYTPKHIIKHCLYNLTFPVLLPFEATDGIYASPLVKIRVTYNEKTEKLAIAPMYFVTWDTKNTRDYNHITQALSFLLPYEINDAIELEGMYMNISYTCNLYLLKSFLDQVLSLGFAEFENHQFESYDWMAYIGNERVGRLIESASSFLKDKSTHYSTSKLMTTRSAKKIKDSPKLSSIMSIMKELRGVYEDRLAMANGLSAFKITYFISYDELFSRYTGRANLMKWIDILCDRGVLVVRNVIDNGFYFRACRSGEGDFNHKEKKTSMLLPIVINTCGEKMDRLYRIKATLLNKITANLAYDYPNMDYSFHNFVIKPYLYGPLTYAKNDLCDEIDTSIYNVEKISNYCAYDSQKKLFLAGDLSVISDDIELNFAQSDTVPYTEIISYIDFLKRIFKDFGKADALNELIICRDQDIYYKHVHFNIVTAYGCIKTAHRTKIASTAEKNSREAARVAKEAIKKLNYNQKSFFEKLKETVGSDIRFRESYKRVLESKVDFSDDFIEYLPSLRYVAFLERAIANLILYWYVLDKKYLKEFDTISSKIDICSANPIKYISELLASKTDEEYNRLYEMHASAIEDLIDRLIILLEKEIENLRKVENSDYVRANKRRNFDVAINKCIQYIKKYSLEKYVLMHFDFSSSRKIEQVKPMNVIKCVKDFVSGLLTEPKSGILIYGLKGSDLFGALLFENMEKAIGFARKISSFLSNTQFDQVEMRFGSCCREVSDSVFNADIEDAWKDASKCSRLTLSQKDNYAGFVVSSATYELMDDEMRHGFVGLTMEESNSDNPPYYTHSDFESNELHRIIRYDSDTDENIKIGIITALPEEFAAMKKMMLEPKTAVFPESKTGRKATGREYCIGRIRSLDGNEHRVALTQTLGPGNTKAASRANSLLERFPNLAVIIMTGIAGGIPNPDDKEKHVRFGDIVIAKEIISYDFVSETEEFNELRDRNLPPSARLLEAQNHLEQNQLCDIKPWEKYIEGVTNEINGVFARPSEDTDLLYNSKGELVNHPEDTSRTGFPKVFREKIASANRLLKNPITRDKLKKEYNVYAIEMEGSGVSDASWEAEIGYYVVRGICDYCDKYKNNIWHNYAALVAAAYTRALVEKLPS